MDKEFRNFEIRMLDESNRTVSGYAIVFNSSSKDMGGMIERIEPTALDGVIEQSDVLCLLNHNEDKGVLARSKYGTGSLKLTIDDKGLLYEFEAPNTALGDELIEGLKRGDITTSSFAFTVESDTWDKQEDGTYIRTINKIAQLYDVSPVYLEAYPDTTVALRKLDEFKQNKDLEHKKQIDEYYTQLKNKYNG